MPRLFTDFDLLLPDHSTISRYILRPTDSIHLFCRSIAFSRASSLQSAVWCNYYSNHRILIKLCAFVGSNCKNWIITHGMEKVKCHLVLALWIYSILSFPKGYSVAVYAFFLVLPPLISFPPSVTCSRRQFLPKMWPIQLAFLLFAVCRVFLSSLAPCNTSSFLTRSAHLISILVQDYISEQPNSIRNVSQRTASSRTAIRWTWWGQIPAAGCMNLAEHADSLCGQNIDCLALNLAGNILTTMFEGIKNAMVTADFTCEGFTFPPRILCVC